jgi:PAS domain S-box-containing protein
MTRFKPPGSSEYPDLEQLNRELRVNLDRQGIIQKLNPETLDMLGLKARECIGRPFAILMHEDDRAASEKLLRGWLGQEDPDARLTSRLLDKDGRVHRVDWTFSFRVDHNKQIESLTGFGRQVDRQHLLEQQLIRESAVNVAMAEVTAYVMGGEVSFEQITNLIRDKAMELTGSRYGFVSSIDPMTKQLICHSLSTGKEECTVADQGTGFEMDDDRTYPGLWGYCLNTGEAVRTEDPQAHPASQGLPEGHITLERYLCIPVTSGDLVLGQISLANAPRPYTDEDQQIILRLAALFSRAIIKKQQNDNFLRQQERLEQLLLERTADLVEAGNAFEEESRARRRAVEALVESQKLVEKTFASLSDAVLVIDAEKRIIVTSNPAAQEVLGYHQTALPGLAIRKLFLDQAVFDAFAKELMPGLDKHGHYSFESNLLRGDGQPIIGQISVTYLLDDDDYLTGMVWSVKDVTASRRAQERQKRLENQLWQAQKMEAIGMLASGVAHDFNNILSAIFGYGELAQSVMKSGKKPEREVKEILKAAERARFLTNQILSFSRTGDQEKTILKLSSTIQEALKLLRATLPTTIDFKVDIQARKCKVKANPTQVHQVIMNLCTNAFHAMAEHGGTLTLRLDEVELKVDDPALPMELKPGRYAKLSVSDTGCGMDQKTLKRIFDPFFTTKEKGQGTGLGLSVVMGIMHNHKGHISARSLPGKGSEFVLYLPVAYYSASSNAKSFKRNKPPGGNEHILFVDDEAALVEIVQRMLTSMGYRVTATSLPQQALDIFQRERDAIDLVITDYTMPVITGTELATRMMQIKPEQAIILCTGYSHQITAAKAKELGIRRYLTKPLMAEDLGLAIREVLDSGS